ncbi:MAG: carbohydrate ABC transporter permease, partial [Herbiconiux sp.]|nr:carbohydrate ABC transporter permease [Herbiconiux sp.]
MSATERLPLRGAGATPSPARWIGRVLSWSVIGVFLLFFIVPIVWLLLAPTKSARQLLLDGPFSFGGFEQLAANWGELMAFQNGIVWVWLGNATLYTGVALVITLVVSIPAGYAMAMVEYRFRKTL